MHAVEIAERLNDKLAVDAYTDIDASQNGLQVGPGDLDVERVAVAVDAAVETIERAIEADADMLVTHHGIVWDNIERITGIHYNRIEPLVTDDIALYVAHLPLDGHQRLGNAAGIANLLKLEGRHPFGQIGDEYVGQRGVLPKSRELTDIVEWLGENLDTGEQSIQTLDFGPETIRTVAIVTGSGADWLDEAAEFGVDLLITGEGKQKVYHEAREAGINVVLAGHYATETFGVKALQKPIESFGLETAFIDCPTGL
jgi:dinuclear metal center YbgI/SA1388 family protein